MPPTRRSQLGRTRTGCMTCRQRHKKCNEQRPVCAGCTRNKLSCVWPSRSRTTKDSLSSEEVQVEDPLSAHQEGGARGRESEKAEQQSIYLETLEVRARFAQTAPILAHTGSPGPLTSLPGISHATVHTPLSPLLLRYYVQSAASILVAKPAEANPFLNVVLPRAYFDDLLMNSILALSAQQLMGEHGVDAEIQRTAWHHYGLALQKIRVYTEDVRTLPPGQILLLLVVTLVLCNVEAFSGNENGALFSHLRAARHLTLHLLQTSPQALSLDQRSCMGFAVETYCFLTLIANVTPYGLLKERTIPFDSFMLSLKHLEAYGTYRIFLACGHELFEHIPRIALLAQRRLQEEDEEGQLCSEHRSAETDEAFSQLLGRIEKWTAPLPIPQMGRWHSEYAVVSEIWRHAIMIYLKATRGGSRVRSTPNLVEIQSHVSVVVQLWDTLAPSPYCTTLMWPALITGSCMTESDQQVRVQRGMMFGGASMMHLKQAVGLLQHLWEDEDERSFGPYGLYRAMEKNEVNLCVV